MTIKDQVDIDTLNSKGKHTSNHAGSTSPGVPCYVAVIRKHDNHQKKMAVLVPSGQSLDFDEGTINRKWLHPFLGKEWHLVEFLEVAHNVLISCQP